MKPTLTAVMNDDGSITVSDSNGMVQVTMVPSEVCDMEINVDVVTFDTVRVRRSGNNIMAGDTAVTSTNNARKLAWSGSKK